MASIYSVFIEGKSGIYNEKYRWQIGLSIIFANFGTILKQNTIKGKSI